MNEDRQAAAIFLVFCFGVLLLAAAFGVALAVGVK